MEQFSATHAKQQFGQLMKAAANAPVAIERHGKVQALVMAPAFFSPSASGSAQSAHERQLARANQALIESQRLIRHQRIALDLLTSPPEERDAWVAHARATVERWRRERLSSPDYIERWARILDMPVAGMARAMVSDGDGWGPALRQNSPWVGLHA